MNLAILASIALIFGILILLAYSVVFIDDKIKEINNKK